MHHFPILLLLLLLLFFFFLGGGGQKSAIMIATLKRIEWNSKPPIPLKTIIKHVKAKACHLVGGDGVGRELTTSFCLFCQKTALQKDENGKGRSTEDPLIRFPWLQRTSQWANNASKQQTAKQSGFSSKLVFQEFTINKHT